ncbi:nuclease-related domain-containing protein [Planktothrix pseudagardhii]|uniref:NERD domain protein (Modular protein) n=1 Tax=Planktothrix pseudagardhii TaxID=132604 RepID=A0A9W4CQW0_9CYAN|nr:nuclease-related domain-containing protein [Planktothrix pseudagardhii]CAD5974862.1 NERD domain protein (Modular protein) [Planktothrix pseudagardhii]
MKYLQQSSVLQKKFSEQVNEKNSANRDEFKQSIKSNFNNNFIGEFAGFFFDIKQFKNQFKGKLGETIISFLLKSLPDSWVMFSNAIIPASSGRFTEIDHLIIGTQGVFLIEVKAWKGSYSAYKDQWKMRDGKHWVPLSKSPSEQSRYHQQVFTEWIHKQVADLPSDFITAPVVFTLTKWIGTNQCSVPVVQGSIALMQLIQDTPVRLNLQQVQAISDAVQYYLPSDNAVEEKVSNLETIKKPKIEIVKKSKIEPKIERVESQESAIFKQAIDDVLNWLKNLPQTSDLQIVETQPEYQAQKIDLLLTTNKGTFKIKITPDSCNTTENFFFETNPSGAFMSSQADWLFYYFVNSRLLYLLPLPETRNWLKDNLNQFSSKVIDNENKKIIGKLVSINDLIENINEARVIRL